MLNGSKHNDSVVLFFIVLVALGFRLAFITHGFPFIYHPDEPFIVREALNIRFSINPGHFDWPHLFVYLNYFLYMGFALVRTLVESWGWKASLSSSLPILWNDSLIFYLLTRIFVAVLGAFTVIPVYLAGKELFSPRVGLLAALVFALIPFHIKRSHYGIVDVPMVFFLSWGLYFTVLVMKYEDTINYILAGLLIGLAGSTKYNGIFMVLVLGLAYLFRPFYQKRAQFIEYRGFYNLFLAFVFLVCGFLIGTPFAVLDLQTFLRDDSPVGAVWQFRNVGKVSLEAQAQKFYESVTDKLQDDFGYTFLISYILMIFYAIYGIIRRKYFEFGAAIWFIIIPSLFAIFYVSGFSLFPYIIL